MLQMRDVWAIPQGILCGVQRNSVAGPKDREGALLTVTSHCLAQYEAYSGAQHVFDE